MIDRQLRATVILAEAAALGLGLEDLVAAHTTPSPPAPTLAEHLAAIAPTFSAGTAATYSSYWRLATEHLGGRRLTDITVVDLQAVVADAAHRARQRRQGSTGRSSEETCVAALRALFNQAHAAGLIAANPAAALTKPRRTRSRHRALDDHELAELVDAIRTTSGDPDLDLLLVRFHLESGARAKAPSTSASATSTSAEPPSGYARRTPATASNPSPPPSADSSTTTPPPAAPTAPTIRSSVGRTAPPSPPGATTPSSTTPAPASNGPT